MKNQWWIALLYILPLGMAIARMKATGRQGVFRTKIVAESEDGEVFEVPFVTITL